MTVQNETEVAVAAAVDATQDFGESFSEKYELLGHRFSSYELGMLWFFICTFLAAYIVCYLTGISYGSFEHARILYALFVLLNIAAASISFFVGQDTETQFSP